MLLSVVVALILSPVLCAGLLKPVEKGHEAAETGFRILRPFFLRFDRLFNGSRDAYERVVGHVLGRRLRYSAVFLVIVAGMVVLFNRMPTAYLPEEDQGMMLVSAQTRPARPSSRPRRWSNRCRPTSGNRSARPWPPPWRSPV